MANIEALMVYDRNCELVYTSREDVIVDLGEGSKELYIEALETDAFRDLEDRLVYSDDYLDLFFEPDSEKDSNWAIPWGVNKQWIIIIQGKESDALMQIEDYFDWVNVIQGISIGSSGSILAVAETDGTVLSFRDKEAEGKSVEELEITFRGETEPASLDRLLSEFSDTDQVAEIEVAGTECFAARVDVDHVLMLALLPEDEVLSQITNAGGILFFLSLMVTALCVFYAYFHIRDEDLTVKTLGRYQWSVSLAGKLKVSAVLAVCSVLLLSLFLGALSVYADIFSYCQREAASVVDLFEDNSEAMDVLREWSEEEYLAKCRIARRFLRYMDEEDVTREYLDELADRLAVKYIYIFDERGQAAVTNSPYDRVTVKQGSPLYPLLEGMPELVCEPEVNEVTGENLQMLGVSLRNKNDESDGFLAVAADPVVLKEISDNLGPDGVFEQICLTDDTCVLVVDDETMQIEYIAEVDGSIYEAGLGSYDYTGLPVSVLGIDEDRLRDNYNGNLFVLNNKYFASVRRTGNDYILVMKPTLIMDRNRLIPVVFEVGATLVLLALLLPLSCMEKKRPEEGAEAVTAGKSADSRSRTETGSIFKGFMSKKKPYFEERWPGEGKRWKEKTQDEKFSAFKRFVIFFAFIAILMHAAIAGEKSIWYYCVNGEWDTGINLYSITNCVISICVLIMIKLLGHKLLYLIAGTVGPRGETICHLIDSSLGYALFIAGVFTCLSSIGVNTRTLSLTGGVAGLIFGIGCQNIVADILAGIIMTFEGVVHVGDFVFYNGSYGTVLSIGVRTTQLKWFSEVTIVRNNDFKNYINMNSDKEDRVICNITVDMKESLENVEAIVQRELPLLHERVCEAAGADVNGPFYRGVQKISENGMQLSFAVYCQGWYYAQVQRSMNRELKLLCERNGIRIALPQIVVNDPSGGSME